MLTSIPAQVLDSRELGDAVRRGDDVAVTVEQINDDGFYSMALPARWDLPVGDPIRTHVDSDSAVALARSEQAAGAYAVPYLRLRLVLEGRRNQQIQITNLEVSDFQIGPPVRGTLVGLSEEGGNNNQQVVFNLDDPIPRALDAEADAATNDKSYFQNKSISLNDREQVVLLAQFNARRDASAQFALTLRYMIGGETRSLKIDNNDRPFRVTAPSCSERGADSVDYDHAYSMVETDQGFGLQVEPDPHHVVSPNLNCN